MHHKLIVFGIVLLAVIVFGMLFWENFTATQQEIANTPLGDMPQNISQTNSSDNMSTSDSIDSIEADLDGTNVDSIDSDNSSLEAELNAL